jgi:putative SOS response-associated peptidase YedK
VLKTGEIFPTDLAPVLRTEGGVLSAVPMVWGFPRWNGGGVNNARAETAADKNMFCAAVFFRPAGGTQHGFFEWKRTGGKNSFGTNICSAARNTHESTWRDYMCILYRQPDGA